MKYKLSTLIITFFFGITFFCGPTFAINWSLFENPKHELKECFLETLNPSLLSKLADGRPDKKRMRKKGKKAYYNCEALFDATKFSKKLEKSAYAGKKVYKHYLGSAPMFQMLSKESKVNLVLFNGGPGWWGNLRSRNYLIRERNEFKKFGANVFIFPNSAKEKMSYHDRLDDSHIKRIRQLVKEIKSINNLPIFLVGISRGTVSVGAFIEQYGQEIKGAILLSGIYWNDFGPNRNNYSMQEIIGEQPKTTILVVHHKEDCCKICEPQSAQEFFKNIKTNDKSLILMSGGNATGNCHGPFHHHGFEGIEKVTAEKIMNWVINKIK